MVSIGIKRLIIGKRKIKTLSNLWVLEFEDFYENLKKKMIKSRSLIENYKATGSHSRGKQEYNN
jgi:hypothetical protein